MSRHQLLVFSRPVPGHEDEYSQWYDAHHTPEMLTLPGFVGAQRFKLTSSSSGDGSTLEIGENLVVYEIESDDIAATMKAARAAAPNRVPTTAMDHASRRSFVFSAATEKVKRP